MAVFHPDTVSLEGRIQARREFLHQEIFRRLHREIHELVEFRCPDIKTRRKLQKKKRIRQLYKRRILKIIKSLLKTLGLNRIRMFFSDPAYKRTIVSYLFSRGLSQIFSNLSAIQMDPFSLLTQPLPNGLFTRTPKAENNSPNRAPDKSTKNSTRAVRPRKRRKKKATKTSDCMKFLFSEIDEIIENPESDGPAVVIYTRVSSWLQVFGGKSLEFQKKELLKLAKQIGASTIYIISDEGKSGRNFSNRKLGTILQLAAAGKITRLLVSEIDRAGRDAFELLFYLFELRRFGVIIQTPKERLDLKRLVDLIILAVKSVAAEEQVVLRGAGSMRTKIGNFLKGEWNLPVPIGYQRKELWIAQVLGWKPVIRAIFTLFLELKNYGSACRAVNRLYGDFLLSKLKKLLKPCQIRRILTNPVYMGKPQLSSAVKEDPSLAMVDPDPFQKAKEIIDAKNTKYARRNKPIEEIFKLLGSEALALFPNVIVPCPICGTKMDCDGSPGYICPKCNKHRAGIKKPEVAALRDYLLIREQILELARRLKKKYKWTGSDAKKWKKLEQLLKEIRGKTKAKTRKERGVEN